MTARRAGAALGVLGAGLVVYYFWWLVQGLVLVWIAAQVVGG